MRWAFLSYSFPAVSVKEVFPVWAFILDLMKNLHVVFKLTNEY